MRASIVKIGNSRGIRIPKVLLEESGIENDVDIQARKGELKIVPIAPLPSVGESATLSEGVLAADWLRPEEDEAWATL